MSSDESIWRTRVMSATLPEYVAGKEMDYDVPCEGVFYRMKGGSNGTD